MKRLLLSVAFVFLVGSGCDRTSQVGSLDGGTELPDAGAVDADDGGCGDGVACGARCCAAGEACVDGACRSCPIPCAGRCCQADETCQRDRCEPACPAETDSELCTRVNVQCGEFKGRDNCGRERTVDCGDCGLHEECSLATHRCRSLCEESEALCRRLGAQCGTLEATDNCGERRTVDCGSCEAETQNVCTDLNLCVFCPLETDPAFCARLDKDCDEVTAPDTCGNTRTVDCGTCAAPRQCSDNVCTAPDAPVNDDCSHPVEIVIVDGHGSASGDTSFATDNGTGSCAPGSDGADMLYKFALSAEKDVVVTVRPDQDSGFVPLVYVRGDCAATTLANELACDRQASRGTASTLKLGRLVAGTYYVWVDSPGLAMYGAFSITVDAADPLPVPENDGCAAPEELVFSPTTGLATASGETRGAYDDFTASCATNFSRFDGPDVVYTFTVSSPMSLRAEVAGSGGLSPAVYLRTICGVDTSEVACGMAAPGTGTAVAAAPFLAPGAYYLIVDGISGSAGSFALEVTRGAPTTNDTCSNPEDLVFDAATGVASTAGDTTWVAPDYSGSCASGWSRELVYRFTLGDTKDVEVVATPTTGSQLKPALYVRSTCDMASTEVGCTRAAAVVPGRLRLSRLGAGTYYLFVDGTDMGTKGAFALSVRATTPARPPTNDSCAAPEPLPFANRKAVVTGTTFGAVDDYAGTCSTGWQPQTGPDLVYSFQLSAASALVAKLTRADPDDGVLPALYLRSSCDSGAAQDENACAAPPAGVAKLAVPNLAAGTWYLVVDSAYGAALDFNLEVQILDLIQNDACNGTPMPLLLDAAGQATVIGDTALARNDADGACNGYTGKDLVYQLTLSDSKMVTAVVTPDIDSPLRPSVYLRSQCADATTDLQCQSVFDPNVPATLQIGRLAAGTYYLWVDGSTYNYDGGFVLQVTAIDPPFIGNDTCAAVQPLQLDSQQEAHLAGTTLGAGDDLRGACQSPTSDFGGDVVYSLALTAPSMVVARVSRDAQSPNYRPAVYLRSTCDSVLPTHQIACAVADPFSTSANATAAAANLPAGTYYLVVDGANDGFFRLDVKVSAPLTNDSCTSPNAAQVLTFNTNGIATAAGDTSAASDDQQAGCDSLGGGDVVYTFTLSAVMDVSIDVAPNLGSSLRPIVYLRRSCEDPSSEIACVSSWSVTYTDLNVPKLAVGTYYLWVEGQAGTAGDYLLTAVATPVAVQPPVNDTCAGVKPLLFNAATHKATVTGDTTHAVDDYRGNCQYSHDPFDGGDLVYSFELAATSSVTARVIRNPTAAYDPAIYIRSVCNSGAAADEVGCAPGAMGTASVVFASLAQGTYYLVVDGFNDGPFTLEVTVEPPITNDNCAGVNGAQPMSFDAATGIATVHGDSAMGADDGSGTCWPSSSGRDLVYSFELASASDVTLTLTPEAGSSLDPLLYLRSSCDDPGTEVLCGYSFFSTAPLTLKKSRLGAGTWYVWVDGFDGTRGGFDLTVEQVPSGAVPSNDTCSAPEVLSFDPVSHTATVNATTLGATDDYSGTCGRSGRYLTTGADRVYSFVLAADARVSATVSAAASTARFAPAVYIRRSCASEDPADELACGLVDFNAPPPAARAAVMAPWLTPGTYYVIVDGLSARMDGQSGSEGDFTLEVTTGPAVTNDTCAQPVELTFDRGVATVSDDTRLGSDSGDGCYWGMSGSDLVYAFTLTTLQNVEATVAPAAGSSYVPYLYLRSVCDSAAGQLACQPGYGSTPVTVTARRLGPGTYYLWVDSGIFGDGAFELTVTLTTPPAPPTNDTCAAPQPLVFDSTTNVAAATGTNTDAGDDYAGSCGVVSGPDLVYSFTLSTAAAVRATATNAAGTGALQPAVYLRSNCASSDPADEAGCASGWSPVSTSALLGPGTWYVIVDSLDRTVGSFDLEVTATPLQSADACVNAAELVLSSGFARTSGDTSLARADAQGSCPSAGKDLVYFFSISTVKTVEVTMTPSVGATTLQPTLHLESSCADVTTEVACSPAPSAGTAAHLLVPRLSPGTWYLWADTAALNTSGAFELTVSAIDPPVPANDTCPGAQPLRFDLATGVASVPIVDTTYAADSAFGTCGGTRGADVFYTFTTQATQKLTATLTRSALTPSFEPVLYVERMCAAFFASDEYTCATERGGQAVAVVNALPAGTYWIVVDGLNDTAGQASLEVALAPPVAGPANDSCATAATLSFAGTTATASGSTSGAQSEATASCSAGDSADVVYAFTTTAEQGLSVSVNPVGANAATFQPAIALQRSCGNARTEVVCRAASAAAATAAAEVKRAPAGTYYLWVSSAGSPASAGEFTLQVTLDAPVGPANDLCAFAVPITLGASPISGTTADAGNDSGATLPGWLGSAAIGGPDVVYSYTAAANGSFTVTVTPSGFDAVVWMSEARCGPGSSAVAYSDFAAASGQETLSWQGTSGTTYFIVVDSATATSWGAFTIMVE